MAFVLGDVATHIQDFVLVSLYRHNINFKKSFWKSFSSVLILTTSPEADRTSRELNTDAKTKSPCLCYEKA